MQSLAILFTQLNCNTPPTIAYTRIQYSQLLYLLFKLCPIEKHQQIILKLVQIDTINIHINPFYVPSGSQFDFTAATPPLTWSDVYFIPTGCSTKQHEHQKYVVKYYNHEPLLIPNRAI